MTPPGIVFVRQLAVEHRKKLLDRVKKINDGAFSSGAAWSLHAIDRIILACDGETDPVKLGLVDKPPTSIVQPPLFDMPEVEKFTRDEMLNKWQCLCDQGFTRKQAATQLRMKYSSFSRALQRARKAGDPRAVLDHQERQAAAS